MSALPPAPTPTAPAGSPPTFDVHTIADPRTGRVGVVVDNYEVITTSNPRDAAVAERAVRATCERISWEHRFYQPDQED